MQAETLCLFRATSEPRVKFVYSPTPVVFCSTDSSHAVVLMLVDFIDTTKKDCLRSSRPGMTQTGLISYRD